MNELWFRTRLRTFPRSVVVLDVSAAAGGLWPVLLSTVEGLGEALPEAARPDVAFLGGRERIPFAAFLRDAERLHAANAGRGRAISPLLDTFGTAWPAKVAILATRPIVDLADWKHTPFSSRLVVVKTDPTASISDGACTEADLTDVDAVAKLVHQPVAAVRVSLPGGLPVAWDNPAFQFADGSLVAESLADVSAGFLSAEADAAPIAEAVRADGAADRIDVEPIDPPGPAPWLPLTSPELTVLDSWRGGRAAHCPRCGEDHAVGVVACRGGGVLLPSLGKPTGGFVRLRVKMFQASFQAVRGSVLRVRDDLVAVRAPESTSPVLWRFDAAHREWRLTGERWGVFERLDAPDEFALALPPVEDAP